ncbi:hypothetical protein [Culturomica massiliensis]|uniref:hypothetical protein n=1 Tax=Culturomica massiliensis TaxID=1841857 RepID=UPI00266F48A7|nr:hypothetical protein [Culturomica massiliensis]
MKNYLITLFLILACHARIYAQNTDMPLQVALPDETDMPEEAAHYLRSRLLGLVTNHGTGVGDYGTSQFFITAKTLLESKDVVGSAPTMYSINLVITLYVVDCIYDRLYAQMSLNAKGVGESETKAYISAIKRMNVNNPKIKSFLEEGRNKIIHYYTTQGKEIMQSVRMLASQRQYEKALFILTAIPSSCEELYNEAQSSIGSIYKDYVNYTGERNLAQARIVWTASQNRAGASQAGSLLAKIDPDATCRPAAEQLVKEIQQRIGEEWTFQMKAYNDSVDLNKQRIEAARQIGVAYGNHQQPNTTNLH